LRENVAASWSLLKLRTDFAISNLRGLKTTVSAPNSRVKTRV